MYIHKNANTFMVAKSASESHRPLTMIIYSVANLVVSTDHIICACKYTDYTWPWRLPLCQHSISEMHNDHKKWMKKREINCTALSRVKYPTLFFFCTRAILLEINPNISIADQLSSPAIQKPLMKMADQLLKCWR